MLGVRGTSPCPSASGQGPSKLNHSGQAATVPGIINNRTTDICSLLMVDRKLGTRSLPWGSCALQGMWGKYSGLYDEDTG